MKTFLITLLSLITVISTFAEIRNGYQDDLKVASQSIQNLKELIEAPFSPDDHDQRNRLKTLYLKTKRTHQQLKAFHAKTDQLIELLMLKHPRFFNQLNHIRNSYGQLTNVYIKVISGHQMQHNQFGTTNLQQAIDDPHVYQSSYGRNSVAVQIRECSSTKQLKLLVHELAHVKYQVPNLASYVTYFQQAYRGFEAEDSFGHLKDDPSNKVVIRELEVFHAVVSGKTKPDLMFAEKE